MLVEKILGSIQELNVSGREVEYVLFAHYDLIRPHQKTKTIQGEELAISLPHGEQLFKGAVLYEDEKRMIVVDLKEEDVLEVTPKGENQWGRAAFNIGNMHQLCYFTQNSILLPYDSTIEKLLVNLGVAYERTNKKLDGTRPNVTMHKNEHSHSHAQQKQHSHEHTHSREHPHSHE